MENLPVHSLDTHQPLSVRDIAYNNPYDFTREHRHDYFEIFFFEKGGGFQLIDFLEIPVLPQSCYVVFPRQIHLLRRAPEANGQLVQFRDEIVPSTIIRSLLRKLSFGTCPAVIFENDEEKISHLKKNLFLLKGAIGGQFSYSGEAAVHYLQALLLEMANSRENHDEPTHTGEGEYLFLFQNLLEEEYAGHHNVGYYAAALNVSEKKLAAVTKKHLGINPLQVIHNRIILEAKRFLVFEDISHKEIAFRLGFDSPATFSQFVRSKTGYTPSELSIRLADIHK